MANVFNDQLNSFSENISRIRRELDYADTATISGALELRNRIALTKSFTYVWLCSSLESLVRSVLSRALLEIGATSIPFNELRNSLYALICDSDLESLRVVNRQNGWQRRVEMFQLLSSEDAAVISSEVIPVGARTLRGESFDKIWDVFGFEGPCLPSSMHRIALKDLADGRNDVAHGHVDPVVFGKSKTASDLRKLAIRVEDIGEHLLVSAENYLDSKFYLRTTAHTV